MDDDKLDKVINGLKVVGGYLDMKSYTDNIAFNLIPHIKDALKLLKEQDNEIDTLKTLVLGYETGKI